MSEQLGANLDKYLTEPILLMKDLPGLSEKIAEYTQEIQAISQYENLSLNAVKTAKNPESHNPMGVMGLYQVYKALLEGLDERKEKIGKGYEIIVDGITTRVDPKTTVNIWQYRLGWLEKALEGLAFIYKDDIKKAIEEQQKLTKEMTEKFNL